VISGFRRDVDGIWALLGCCAAYNDDSLPTFRDNLSIPSSRVKKSKIRPFISWPLKLGPMGCPETSVRNYPIRCVKSQKS